MANPSSKFLFALIFCLVWTSGNSFFFNQLKQACKVDCKKMETDMASGKIKLEDLKVVPTYCLLFFKDDIKCKDKSDNKLQDILDKLKELENAVKPLKPMTPSSSPAPPPTMPQPTPQPSTSSTTVRR